MYVYTHPQTLKHIYINRDTHIYINTLFDIHTVFKLFALLIESGELFQIEGPI